MKDKLRSDQHYGKQAIPNCTDRIPEAKGLEYAPGASLNSCARLLDEINTKSMLMLEEQIMKLCTHARMRTKPEHTSIAPPGSETTWPDEHYFQLLMVKSGIEQLNDTLEELNNLLWPD